MLKKILHGIDLMMENAIRKGGYGWARWDLMRIRRLVLCTL